MGVHRWYSRNLHSAANHIVIIANTVLMTLFYLRKPEALIELYYAYAIAAKFTSCQQVYWWITCTNDLLHDPCPNPPVSVILINDDAVQIPSAVF